MPLGSARSPRRGLLLGILAVVGLACAPASEPPHPGARNLVLVSIDTLRADRLGCYGYGRPTTPHLDALAARGVLFEQAYAPSPWTMPSHASLFTGLYPRRNGMISMRHSLAPGVDSLATILGDAGFATGAVVSNELLTARGLESGFETLEEADQGGPHPSDVAQRAIAWLRERERERRFFLLVHFIDPHSDYTALPEFAEPFLEPYDGPATGSSEQLFEFVRGQATLTAADARHLSNLYDGGVRQLDEEIGKLTRALEEEGLFERTLLVVTSDHGEEFLEHGGLMHGQNQHEEVVRVPLLVLGPGVPAGERVPAPVSLVDVVPTVLEVLGLPPRDGLDGLSLRGSWSGATLPERALYFEADLDPPGPEGHILKKGTERAVRAGRFKLHLDRRTKEQRLYDLESDPGEREDVTERHPEAAARLRAELDAFLSSSRATKQGTLDREDIERLKRLGYAGDGE